MNDTSHSNDELIAHLRRSLRATEPLSAAEAQALAASRKKALAALAEPRWHRLFSTLPHGALALPAALAVAVTVWVLRPAAPVAVNLPDLAALEYAADVGEVRDDEQSAAFYQDLEFYQWLDHRKMDRPDA